MQVLWRGKQRYAHHGGRVSWVLESCPFKLELTGSIVATERARTQIGSARGLTMASINRSAGSWQACAGAASSARMQPGAARRSGPSKPPKLVARRGTEPAQQKDAQYAPRCAQVCPPLA